MEKGTPKQDGERLEDLKYRGEGVLQLAKGVARLPVAPIAMVRGNTRKNLENAERLKKTATHELGHMLAMLFQDQRVKGVYVLRNRILRESLGMPMGITTNDNPAVMFATATICGNIAGGIIKILNGKKGMDFDFDRMNENQKVNFMINLLSGEAAELPEQNTDSGEHFYTGDVTSDASKAKSTLEASKELNKPANEIMETFHAELVSFFREPQMQRILNVLKDELLKTDYLATFGKSLDKKILQILEKNGITKTEFEEEKKRFHALIKKLKDYLNGCLNR